MTARPRASPLLPLAAALLALGCAGSRAPAPTASAAPPPADAAPLPYNPKCRRPRPDDVCRKGYRLVCDEGIGILRCDRLPEE